jgi:hypothetical protein
MLRSFVFGLGVLTLICGLVAIYVGGASPGFVILIWGVLIVGGVVFERVRYKPLERTAPAGDWVRTTERFIDDATGAPVTVWLDPKTGERKYVKD